MKPLSTMRPRARTALGTGLALAALTVVASAVPAQAYETFTSTSCSALTWTSAPRVVVHTNLPGGDFGDSLNMLVAIQEVNDELGRVGATSARITSTTTSTDAFVQEDWFNDPVPTIHVGFHSDPDGDLGSGGPGVSVNCQYDEAHIGFMDLNLASWSWGTPEDGGQTYYDATLNDATGARYFRLAYLHELLHTFGLNHSDSSYSMLNYGDRPWFDEDTIRPLPDDVLALRELYPQAGTRHEVSVHNTFYSAYGVENGAAPQEKYCAPSLGDYMWSDMFAPHCGSGGPDSSSTEVCPGDLLHTRFTLGNYSTEEAHLTARLWLSEDDQWDSGDLRSPTRFTYDVPDTASWQNSATFEVPSLGFGEHDYYVILRVKGTVTTGEPVESWLPLTGPVQFDWSHCTTPEEWEGDIDPVIF